MECIYASKIEAQKKMIARLRKKIREHEKRVLDAEDYVISACIYLNDNFSIYSNPESKKHFDMRTFQIIIEGKE